jgi:ABC-type sugar transport system permease subunit
MKSIGRNINLVSVGFYGLALLVFIFFTILPAGFSFFYSFTDWNGISKEFDFVGWENYAEILSGERFPNAMKNTALITVVNVAVVNILALALALAMDTVPRGKSILRGIFFSPQLLSAIIVSFMWSYMMNYHSGLINRFLDLVGLGGWKQDWLGDIRFVMASLITIVIWQGIGFYMVIYLANLQTIPQDLLDAARVDGAGKWHQFRHVVFPLLAPAVTTCVVLAIINSLNIFDQVQALTGGGPGFRTETMVVSMVYEATRSSRQGIASAEAMVLFVATALISLSTTKYLRAREVEY